MKIKGTCFLLTLFLGIHLLAPKISTAQQMVVDDATLAEKHVFEAWAGTEESWVQPSVAISRAWNISPGIIFNTSNREVVATHWLIESKVVPPPLSNNQWSAGNVSAAVFDFDGSVTQIYSYVPLSINILNYNSFIHLNLGIEANQFNDEWEYDITSGLGPIWAFQAESSFSPKSFPQTSNPRRSKPVCGL